MVSEKPASGVAGADRIKTASPRLLLRRYIELGPEGCSPCAPSALICTTWPTPEARAARAIVSGRATWVLSKTACVPCKIATRLTTASCPGRAAVRAASLCTSNSKTVNPGRCCKWLALVRRRVGTVTSQPWRTNFSQSCEPTKPLPPKTMIFFIDLILHAAATQPDAVANIGAAAPG